MQSRSAPQGRRSVPFVARLLPIMIGLGGVMVFLATNCKPGPFGRNQVLALSLDDEKNLGKQAFVQALSSEKVLDERVQRISQVEKDLVTRVEYITARLIAAARDPNVLKLAKVPEDTFEWEVRVVENDTPNAYCLPGGKMVVYTGIIPVAYNDAALAAVIGHEISHALFRHGNERMSTEKAQQMAAMAAAGAFSDDVRQQQFVMAAFGIGTKVGITLPFNRSHELEADRMGVVLMAAAGYPPEESIRFWERMGKLAGGAKPPEYLSTHPSDSTRMSELTEWMPTAQPYYDSSQKQRVQVLPGLRAERQ
ncbi:MAG: M48 family metallopeptidase [Pirellulales bacterium]|nr:M48 family metallopeptidase [Pirellulales bacterium]